MASPAHRRLAALAGQIGARPTAAASAGEDEGTVLVRDNRTGKEVEIVVRHNTIDAKKLAQLKYATAGGDSLPMRVYDPGYKNTAAATSRITFIDGAKGILLYRGYPIEQLAEKSTFLEVSYLLLYGNLPSKPELDYFSGRVQRHTFANEELKRMMKSFRYDAHPMGMVMSTMAAMSTFHPEANPALQGQRVYDNPQLRQKQVHRILGTMPTLAAFAYRHRIGRPYVDPSHEPMSYTGNFLYMLDRLSNPKYKPHPRLARALDVLFILHADHELNASTAAVRHLTSTGVDVYTSIAGGVAALYGPKHGGANQAVLQMLESIGDKSNIPEFIQAVKAKKVLLSGFGHRVYKNYDPRARIVQKVAYEVFSILGREPLIEVALELERVALSDPYFKKRNLYPNIDFFSGLIYKAMGFPADMFPVLFAIPRTAGWLSHWLELLDDPENVIVRPRQVYLGADRRDYVGVEARAPAEIPKGIKSYSTAESRRRSAAGVPA